MNYDSSFLAQYLGENGIQAEIIHLEVDTPTVETAARAIDAPTDRIVKSLLFLADQEPVLVIANGIARVERKLLANYLGISPKRLKIGSLEQVLLVTGYPAGALPPFGHKQKLRTILETSVLGQAVVYAGGGGNRALMRLRVTELQRVVGAETADLMALPI